MNSKEIITSIIYIAKKQPTNNKESINKNFNKLKNTNKFK